MLLKRSHKFALCSAVIVAGLAAVLLLRSYWQEGRGQDRAAASAVQTLIDPASVGEVPKRGFVPSPEKDKPLEKLLAAHRSGDWGTENRLFGELEGRLLHLRKDEGAMADAVISAINDTSLDSGFRMGLLQAAIEGASSPLIPRIMKLYKSSQDGEITAAILAKLPDLQGNARLVDQGVNVTPELIEAFSSQPSDSSLLPSIAVALTKMGDARALGFLINQVADHVAAVEEIKTSSNPRLDAAVFALADNRIPSGEAVPYLAGMLKPSAKVSVDTYMSVLALSSIGNTDAVKTLLVFFESAPDSYASLAEQALGRLTHPEARELIRTALAERSFSSSPVKAVVEGVASTLGQ